MSIKAEFTYIITEMKNQWNNITIDEFAQIRAVLTDKGSNQEEKMIRLAAIVKGVSEDTILNLPLTQAQEVFAQVWELNEMPHRNKVCKQKVAEVEAETFDKLAEQGCTVIPVEDKAPWVEACQPTISENTSDQAELYQQILDMAK